MKLYIEKLKILSVMMKESMVELELRQVEVVDESVVIVSLEKAVVVVDVHCCD